MADSKTKRTKRTKTSAATEPSDSKKQEDSMSGGIESPIDKTAVLDFVHSTKEELRKLGEKIHEAADKSVIVAKHIAEDVRKFSKDATDLTKMKIDLHNLKADREKRYASMGKQLSKLNKAKNLRNIKAKFRSDFAKLEELESDINKKEKKTGKIALLKKSKRRTLKS